MNITDTVTIWICTDCMMLLANGETPHDMSEAETEEYLNDVEDDAPGQHTVPGLRSEEHECDEPTEGTCSCETIEFSMSRCDMCRRPSNAGTRHAATVLIEG